MAHLLFETYRNVFSGLLARTLGRYIATVRGAVPSGVPAEVHALKCRVLETQWTRNWAAEFFCDCYAVYTFGPTFGHELVRLGLGHKWLGTPGFGDEGSHPALLARAAVSADFLESMGLSARADEIRIAVAELRSATAAPSSDQAIAYPPVLTGLVIRFASAAFRAVGLRRFDEPSASSVDVRGFVIAAGERRLTPDYASWEREELQRLWDALGVR